MRIKSLLLFLCISGLLLHGYGCGSSTSPPPGPPASGDTVPPSDVVGFTSTPGIGTVLLSWQAATDDVGVGGYKVSLISPVFAASRTSDTSAIVDSSTLSISWSGLEEGVTYTFSIVAFDTSNNSSVNPAILTTNVQVPDLTPPLDVTGLVGAGGWNDPLTQNFVEINLSWSPSASPDVSHYLVCIRTVGSSACDILNNLNVGNNTVITVPDDPNGPVLSSDLGAPLQIDTEYSIRVITIDTSGNQSSPGATALVVPTQSSDTTPPQNPVENLTAVPGNQSVTLSWTEPQPPGDAASYAVYFRTPPASETVSWTSFQTTTATTSTVTGLTNGVAYEFMVAAIDASGNEQDGAATAITADDVAAKVPSTPASGLILSVPNIQGGVFRQDFFTGRQVVVAIFTGTPGLLNATASTEFFFTLDGSQVDPTDRSTDQRRGYYDFAGSDVGANPFVTEIAPGFMYAVTIDFDPSTAGAPADTVNSNTLHPNGGPDHIVLNYQVVRAGVDASPIFSENYLIYQRNPDEFIKFSGMRENRWFQTSTLVEAGVTEGDVIIIGGLGPGVLDDASDDVALTSAERYRKSFEHFEEVRATGLSAAMSTPRRDHRATFLPQTPPPDPAGAPQAGPPADTVIVTGGFNYDGDTVAGGLRDGLGNESLGLKSFEVFRVDPVNEGFDAAAGGSLGFSRRYHTATRLYDGRVLLVGGLNGEQNLLGSLGFPVPAVQDVDFTVCLDTSVTALPPNQDFVGAVLEVLDASPASAAVSRGVIAESITLPLVDLHCFTVHGLAVSINTGTPFRVINAAFDGDPTTSVAAEMFNPNGASAGPLASTPRVPRYGHTATLLHDGTVFIAGGVYDYRSFGAIDALDELSCEIFEPDSNTFLKLGDLADLRTTRFFHTATLLRDGKVLLTGGFNRGDYAFSSGPFPVSGFDSVDVDQLRRGSDPRKLPDKVQLLNTAELFDPFTRTTRFLGYRPTQPTIPERKLNRPRFFHTASLLPSGKVLICGGFIAGLSDGSLVFDGSAEIYDPDTEQFTVTNDMITARGGARAVEVDLPGARIDGQILLNGGSNNTLAALYNETKNRYEATAHSLTFDRFVGAAVTPLMDGTFLVSGGQAAENTGITGSRAGAVHDTAEIYDSSKVLFTPVDDLMANHRRHHTATLLQDGTVLIAGGEYLEEEPDGNVRSIGLGETEIYDPGTGEFSEVARMNEERYKHTATLLPDGRVLVCGGSNGIASLQSCEVYDPVIQAFDTVPNMSVGRFDHTATLLPNGWVMIAGGESIDDTSVELFDPVTESFVPSTLFAGRNGHTAVNPAYTMGRARFANGSPTVVGSGPANPFGYDDTSWAAPAGIVRPGDIIMSESQNVPYVIAAVVDNNTITLANHPDFIHDDSGYSGASTIENQTSSQSPTGFEHYVILSQDVYVAGGEVRSQITEVFDFDVGDDEFPLADPADSQFFPGSTLDAAVDPPFLGRYGQSIASSGDMTLLIVGSRNRDFAEYTNTNATPVDFTDDPWSPATLDPPNTVWEFPDAFRVRNNAIIVIQQHSAQAFLHY